MVIEDLGFSSRYFSASKSGFVGLTSVIDLTEVPFTKKPLALGPVKQRSERTKLTRTRMTRAKITERQN